MKNEGDSGLNHQDLLSSARVAIAGLGLMGGSLAMALRGQCAELLGVDPDPHIVTTACAQGVVDRASVDPVKIFPMADLVILAAPVQGILELLSEMDHLHPGNAVIFDLGSTKSLVMTAMTSLPERFDPLGGHPLCGKEKSSLDCADPSLYQGAAFVLCALPRTSARACKLARQLVGAIGAHSIWLDAITHDRWIASTSHLPYLLANALVQAMPEQAAQLIGPGFRSASRLAGGAAPMMLDVLQTNREFVLEVIQGFHNELDRLENRLRQGDWPGLLELLSLNTSRRALLLQHQQHNSGLVDREG
jgi:prephenate dehydrogenase